MINQEYEAKKRECWKEFTTMSLHKAFNYAFDYAYSLGKEKETITQEDIEKAAYEYAKDAYYPAPDYGWYESDDEQMKEVLENTFKAGVNFALGKQEKVAEDGSLWSRLTDAEKREMQCRYHTNECVLRDHRKRTGDKAQSKAVARMKLLENLFGEENLNVEKK